MADTGDDGGIAIQGRQVGRGTNQSGLRARNERLILTLLRSNGPTAKADVARMTGLSAQSASVIMRNLERDGLVERCPPIRGKVGQPLVPMRLSPEGALFFGLKVGRRSSDLLLVDFLGQIIDRTHLSHRYPDPDGTLRFVRASMDAMTAKLSARQRSVIAGLGISLPGFLWEWARIIGEPPEKMDAWRHRDIQAEIAEIVDFPVFRQNDASCACSAELVFGDGDYPPDFLYFYVGYFIGGGIVLNGALFTGPTGNAGAFGTLPVAVDGEGTVQLLNVASLAGLENAVADAGGDSSALHESPSDWHVDPALIDRWLDRATDGLAYAIVATCSVIDFELAVIDGWLPAELRRDLVARTARKLPDFNLSGLIHPELREGTIGPDARAIGAASLPLSQRFQVSRNVF